MVGNSYTRTQSIQCNGCGDISHLEGDDIVCPPGWTLFRIPGWVGDFHACSESCQIRARWKADGKEDNEGGDPQTSGV